MRLQKETLGDETFETLQRNSSTERSLANRGTQTSPEASSDLPKEIPVVLILHDGELDDIRPIFDSLGVPSLERRGRPLPADAEIGWDLVIAPPQKLLDLTSERGMPVGRIRVAVADGDSHTLRAIMNRANVDFFVRRPVHPVALRKLLVQSLYRGSEKRRSRRLSVGVPVRFRTGLRAKLGVLADLSPTGCQLLASDSVLVGQNLTVSLPHQQGKQPTLSVRGIVVRAGTSDQAGDFRHKIHIAFQEQSEKVVVRLAEIVESFEKGPAQLPRDFVEERIAETVAKTLQVEEGE